MKHSLTLLLLLCTAASAQIPIIPSTPVEQTQAPVFADFKPTAKAQTIEHGEALANFRLRLDFKGGVTLRLNPKRTLELKGADDWQLLDLQYEQLRGKPASFSATVNGKSIADSEVIAGTMATVCDRLRYSVPTVSPEQFGCPPQEGRRHQA
jgi:hypothetical protein